jgi:hypothetical protein
LTSENLNPSCPKDFSIVGTFFSYVLLIRMLPCGVAMRKALKVLVPT